MKKNLLFSLTLLAFLLASCGGNRTKTYETETGEEEEKVVLTPADSLIGGDLTDYYTIVNRDYTPVGDYGKKLTLDFVRTATQLPEGLDGKVPFKNFGSTYSEPFAAVKLHLEFIDDDGNIVGDEDYTSLNSGEFERLAKLKPGQQGSIVLNVYNSDIKGATRFRVFSQTEYYPEGNRQAKDTEEITEDVASPGIDASEAEQIADDMADAAEVDLLLDQYEALVDQYIDAVDNADPDDTHAVLRAKEVFKKSDELYKKLRKGKMSAKQAGRLAKLYGRVTAKAATVSTKKTAKKAYDKIKNLFD